jgi:hypothetical protein
MSTWNDLQRFIHSKFKAEDVSPNLTRMVFEYRDGRSQMVLVRRVGNDSVGEWASVESAIGRVGASDLLGACREIADNVVGGIAVVDDLIVLRDTFPLADLSPDEFLAPLQLISSAADELEKVYGDGRDSY